MSIENDVYRCERDIENLKDKYNNISKILCLLTVNSCYIDNDGDERCRFCNYLWNKHDSNCPTELIKIL